MTRQPVGFAEAVRVWARIGLLSFGGPAGQIALMHDELVERRKWVDEARFLHALNYCMLLPGPEAQQLATYIGWLMHRTPGALAAGLLFILPGFVSILVLSAAYATFHDTRAVSALFFGLKAAVLAVVIEALLRIGRRALKTPAARWLAVAAFIALFAFDVPFPFVVVVAALLGLIGRQVNETWFPLVQVRPANDTGAHDTEIERLAASGGLEHTRPSWRRAVRVLLVCGLVWAAPVAGAAWAFGANSVFVSEAVFFSKAAVVTFGGAYAVLAYVAQHAVEHHGWLGATEMLDGLGLAETTPGPLIMVVQFVGFMGAYRQAGFDSALLAGVLGSALTVWVTFVPCFMWILLGAPFIEALRGQRHLGAALSAITAAVVGVIANLSVWFSMHVIFHQVEPLRLGPVHLQMPEFSSIDWVAVGLSGWALLSMFKWSWGLPKTLASTAALGLVAAFIRT